MGEDFDFFDIGPEPEPEGDEFAENAMDPIEEIIATQRVVTEREVKVRLEDKFFPWVTGLALRSLVKMGRVAKQGLPGRRGKIETKNFYSLPNLDYDEIIGEMREKRDVSKGVNAMLTGHAPAAHFAEDLFERAFTSLDFEIIDRNASEYKGRKANGVSGKESPNLDFILERDKTTYGVDVKNWIKFEAITRKEVVSKVNIALKFEIVPFIIARYVDKDTIYKEIILKGGFCYPYRTLIFPPDFESLSRKANQLLGYPVIALDRLPQYKAERIEFLHKLCLRKRKA